MRKDARFSTLFTSQYSSPFTCARSGSRHSMTVRIRSLSVMVSPPQMPRIRQMYCGAVSVKIRQTNRMTGGVHSICPCLR